MKHAVFTKGLCQRQTGYWCLLVNHQLDGQQILLEIHRLDRALNVQILLSGKHESFSLCAWYDASSLTLMKAKSQHSNCDPHHSCSTSTNYRFSVQSTRFPLDLSAVTFHFLPQAARYNIFPRISWKKSIWLEANNCIGD